MIQVDFAIITIREDEFDAVLERFPQKRQKGSSGRIYGISQVKTQDGQNCIVALTRSSEQGNDAAQQVANDVISDLDPQMLLIVGIAGGVPSYEFTLGDVIISSRIDNFNVSKRDEDGTETFNMTSGIDPVVSNITANLRLYQEELVGWDASITLRRPTVDLSQFDTDTFKEKIAASTNKNVASWYEDLKDSMNGHFGKTRPPLYKTGRIASSNSIIRNINLFVQWLQAARSILAVEMESAGVYQATQKINKRYQVMAIRGISDIIGLKRSDQWTKYACQTAAAFAYAFVTAGIITPRATSTVTTTPASVSPPATPKPTQPPSKQADGTGPIDVFISYAAEDEKFKKQLETHLTLLKREGVISTWNSQQTTAGLIEGAEQEIATRIDSAQIILLLMSTSFLASDDLYKNQMMRAINRQQSGKAVRVIPIAVRYVAPGNPDIVPFQKIQGLPRNGKPIESWRSADEAWAMIAQEIREVCKDLRENTSKY